MAMDNTKTGRLLSPQQVASMLLINRQTLAIWRHQKRGPTYIKLGGAVRYRLNDIERWIDDNTINHNSVEAI